MSEFRREYVALWEASSEVTHYYTHHSPFFRAVLAMCKLKLATPADYWGVLLFTKSRTSSSISATSFLLRLSPRASLLHILLCFFPLSADDPLLPHPNLIPRVGADFSRLDRVLDRFGSVFFWPSSLSLSNDFYSCSQFGEVALILFPKI